jgi:hypothetical protein
MTGGANVWDLDATGEHLITQSVLAAHSGNLGVRYVGCVKFDKDILIAIKGAINQLGARVDAEREKVLWQIEGEEWHPLFSSPHDLVTLLDQSDPC